MARRIDLLADALVVSYTGMDAAATLTGRVRVPYDSIRLVRVGLTDPPGALAIRIGTSTPPFGTTQRGRFRERGRWSFLDVNDRERTVVLDLAGHEFRRVALTVDDPEPLAARLREHQLDATQAS
jgi:hypothetical protein